METVGRRACPQRRFSVIVGWGHQGILDTSAGVRLDKATIPPKMITDSTVAVLIFEN